MTACGKNNTISDPTSDVQDSSQTEEASESEDIGESKDHADDQIGFELLADYTGMVSKAA